MHNHETNHGETLRQNPSLSAGSARVRAAPEHHLCQGGTVRHGERPQAAGPAEAVRQLVHARFRRCSQSGVLERLFAALLEQEAVGDEVFCFGLDSTCVKAHPDGAGARKTSGSQASASRAADGVRRSA